MSTESSQIYAGRFKSLYALKASKLSKSRTLFLLQSEGISALASLDVLLWIYRYLQVFLNSEKVWFFSEAHLFKKNNFLIFRVAEKALEILRNAPKNFDSFKEEETQIDLKLKNAYFFFWVRPKWTLISLFQANLIIFSNFRH